MGVANITGNLLNDTGLSLSSYLPLTGGTLTGALNGTSATFSSSVSTSGPINITVPYSAGTMTFLTQDNLGNGIYLAPRSNLNFDYGVAGNTTGIINQFGYQNGSAHFRSLQIGNGKGGSIAFFDGTTSNVGIGTSSPTAWNGNQGLLVSQTGTGNTNTIYSLQSGATSVDTGSILEGFSTNTTSGSKALGSIVFLRENTSTTALSSYTAFYTNNGGTVSEKMRLSSGGVLTINGTFVQNPSSGSGGLYIDRGTSTSSPYISWFNGSGTRLGYMGYSNTNIGLYLENSAAFIVSAGDTYLGTSTIDKNSRLVIYGNSTTSSAYTLRCFSSGSDVLFQVRNDGLIQTGTLSGSPYNNTSGAAANMVVNSAGTLERSTSSLKYKKDVKDYDKGLAEVMAMRPVYYKGKGENDGDKQFAGLIAEEIDALGLNEFVTYAEDGSPDALAYQNMIALLTKAIQELSAKVTALENK